MRTAAALNSWVTTTTGTPAFQPAHDALQRLDLLELCRIHVDDEGAEIGLLDLAAQLGDILLDGRELDDLRGGERRARVLQRKPCHWKPAGSSWS